MERGIVRQGTVFEELLKVADILVVDKSLKPLSKFVSRLLALEFWAGLVCHKFVLAVDCCIISVVWPFVSQTWVDSSREKQQRGNRMHASQYQRLTAQVVSKSMETKAGPRERRAVPLEGPVLMAAFQITNAGRGVKSAGVGFRSMVSTAFSCKHEEDMVRVSTDCLVQLLMQGL